LLVTFLFVYNFNKADLNQQIDKELSKLSNNLQNSYSAITKEITLEAISTSSIIHDDETVIKIMREINNSDKKDVLRKELYTHLEPLYQMLQLEGVVSFHFSLPNNISFLRMHQPTSYGDDLASYRYTVKSVNKTHKESIGLEAGLYNISYRHVFPLFDFEENYLGAFEISYSIDYIQKLMKEIDGIKTDLLTSKNKFNRKGWESRYKYITQKMKENKPFTTFIQKNSSSEVAIFLPLKDIQNNKTLGYIISYSNSEYINSIIKRNNIRNIITFFVMTTIFILLYKLIIYQRNIAIERERFQLAIDSSNEGIWDWNITSNDTYFSPQLKNMLGFEQDEFNDSFEEFKSRIHKNDIHIFLQELSAIINHQKDIFDCEYRVESKDGKWIWIQGRAKAQYDRNKNASRIVGFQSDITLKKEYEEKQKHIIAELKEAADAKSNFLATMSHEIRTPMNAVLGFIQILLRKEDDPKKLKMLNTINESGNSLLRIINDILDFSKISNNKLEIDMIEFNLYESLKHVKELYISKTKDKNLSINLSIDNQVPDNVYTDKLRLEQIVSNLVSNAIKFSKENTTIDIKSDFIKESNSLRFSVTDHGIGIPKNKLTHIFDTFTQEDSSTTRKYGGTGLGLAICKQLCHLMSGDIWVESEVNKGSSFIFVIPQPDYIKPKEIDTQKSHIETQDTKNIPTYQTSTLNGKVLIVEDNMVNQELLCMLLSEYSLQFSVANDGLEAIGLLQNDSYDLILMDENMPNMNGIEATKIIKEMESVKDIPIIAVTANALSDDRDRFIEAGMDDYISKPIDSAELDKMLNKYLKN
jgi:PAS domain S-box-containing protein